jgi:hypothetical protein
MLFVCWTLLQLITSALKHTQPAYIHAHYPPTYYPFAPIAHAATTPPISPLVQPQLARTVSNLIVDFQIRFHHHGGLSTFRCRLGTCSP